VWAFGSLTQTIYTLNVFLRWFSDTFVTTVRFNLVRRTRKTQTGGTNSVIIHQWTGKYEKKLHNIILLRLWMICDNKSKGHNSEYYLKEIIVTAIVLLIVRSTFNSVKRQTRVKTTNKNILMRWMFNQYQSSKQHSHAHHLIARLYTWDNSQMVLTKVRYRVCSVENDIYKIQKLFRSGCNVMKRMKNQNVFGWLLYFWIVFRRKNNGSGVIE
jgi:hypothetical protein